MGQLLHEQPQHGAEVVLRAGHRDLHGRRRLRVAVAAVSAGGTGDRCLREPARLPGAQPRTPLPKLGVVTTRWSGSPPPTWAAAAPPRPGRREPAGGRGAQSPPAAQSRAGTRLGRGEPGGDGQRRGTHYLCIRETMVLKAACTSAAEQVHTTGSVWRCRASERNCGRADGEPPGLPRPRPVGRTPDPTCPCQSDVLTRMMCSGSWSSETRMWFSWSYTVFLGICGHGASRDMGRSHRGGGVGVVAPPMPQSGCPCPAGLGAGPRPSGQRLCGALPVQGPGCPGPGGCRCGRQCIVWPPA